MIHRRLLSLLALLALLMTAPVAAGPPANDASLSPQLTSFAAQAGPCTPGAAYDPACDVDHDGDVDIIDVQLAAGHWNQAGTWTGGDYWSLTGNAGTTPGTHFLGTTDGQVLELRVAGQRALRLEPTGLSPNIVGGHSGNSVTAGVIGATIGGGGWSETSQHVTDNYGTIGGGSGNRAGNNTGPTTDAYYSTVSGGWDNEASGKYAAVPGGESNTASGDFSLAAGHRANASNPGCFVWGDATNNDVGCSAANRWVARASGGVDFFTDASLTSGVYLSAGGSSWNMVSNRERKESFVAVDGRDLLARLAGIEISTWSYKTQGPSIRHIGPMADDFNSLLAGLGGEGQETINSLDADGVALAAIQVLYQLVQEQQAQLAAQQRRIEALTTPEQMCRPAGAP
jgi:hypothetical protein